MKTNVPKNVTGSHKNIIIIILAVIVLVAIIAAVFFKGSGKKDNSNSSKDTTSTAAGGSPETEKPGDAQEGDEQGGSITEQETIETLILQYRKAFADADIEALKAIYNTSDVMNSDTITATAKIITGYENTQCYIKDGMDESSKVVFIYDDLKVDGIDTRIPNIAYVYLMKKGDGSYYIYPGEYDQNTANYVYSSEIQKYISELIKESDIKALYATTNEKFNSAYSEDEKVKAFVDKLTKEDSSQTLESESQTQSN